MEMDSALFAKAGLRQTPPALITESRPANAARTSVFAPLLRRLLVLIACIYFSLQLSSAAITAIRSRVWSVSSTAQLTSGANKGFDWFETPSHGSLEYRPCYNGFQCARLDLPLDYFNDTTDKRIGLAIVRLPAVVPVTDSRYGGAIVFNPGGPGGSGVSLVVSSGLRLRSILDAQPGQDGKYFDLIGFDPRGTGMSEPGVHCFSGQGAIKSWFLRSNEEGILTSSDAALGRLWSMSQAQWGSCTMVEEDDIQHFVATSSVATDMVGIIEAHGKWREQEAARLSTTAVSEDLKHKPGKEKLQYWGFSYGSFLGTTFASMYPERVGRVILDGVVDAEDYSLNLWYDNLVDTEKEMNLFYYHCARIGFPNCPLATPNQKTEPQAVYERFQSIIANLYHNPLPVMGLNAEVVSWSDIRNVIFASLYSPIEAFPYLANILAQLEQGDGTEMARLLKAYHSVQCSAGQDDHGNGLDALRNRTKYPDGSQFAGAAILCTDGDAQSWQNKTTFDKHIKSLQELSPTLGAIWAQIRLQCTGYPLRPYHRYTGPWAGKTAHPILWIGNTADPVTPVGSAMKIAKGFPGSVVLTQDGPGHCSIAAFSKCTTGYINAYFQTGLLPPEGTVCDVDVVPWGPSPDDDAFVTEDIQMGIRGHAEIASAWHQAGGGLGRSRLLGRIDDRVFT